MAGLTNEVCVLGSFKKGRNLLLHTPKFPPLCGPSMRAATIPNIPNLIYLKQDFPTLKQPGFPRPRKYAFIAPYSAVLFAAVFTVVFDTTCFLCIYYTPLCEQKVCNPSGDKSRRLLLQQGAKQESADKMRSTIQEIKARRGRVLVISDPIGVFPEDEVIALPTVSPEINALLAALPLQLFAMFSAELRGCNIDRPRNLAKSVTVD